MNGEAQSRNGLRSTRHWKRTPASLAVNWKVGVRSVMRTREGPSVIVVWSFWAFEEETGEILGFSQSTVSRLWHLAIQKLPAVPA